MSHYKFDPPFPLSGAQFQLLIAALCETVGVKEGVNGWLSETNITFASVGSSSFDHENPPSEVTHSGISVYKCLSRPSGGGGANWRVWGHVFHPNLTPLPRHHPFALQEFHFVSYKWASLKRGALPSRPNASIPNPLALPSPSPFHFVPLHNVPSTTQIFLIDQVSSPHPSSPSISLFPVLIPPCSYSPFPQPL